MKRKTIIIITIIITISIFIYYIKKSIPCKKESLKYTESIDNSFSRCAIVIPIHPPHYHFLYDLLNTIITDVVDIFLIFSNEDDYNKFTQKNKIKSIILPNNIKTDNIVTFKKFYALKNHLIKLTEYEYYIVCDAEIKLIPENFNQRNIINKIEQIYNNKIIYAGSSDNNNKIINIIKNSCSLFKNNINDLGKITNNFTLYSWWSDLPVYKRSHLKEFFEIINFDNINWHHFDHMIYQFYLILYHNFTILNITDLINWNHSLEGYNTSDINILYKLKNNKYGFSWIDPSLFNNHKDFLLKEGSFILYHLDR